MTTTTTTTIDPRLILLDTQCIPDFDMGTAASMTQEDILAAYNGCGPERWPEAVRAKMDDLTSLYAAAVLIHDCDFTNSDGTEEKLAEATARFRSNTAAILAFTYPLWTWKQLRPSYRVARAKAVALKAAMDLGVSPRFCRKAWWEAYTASKTKEA